MVCESKSNKSHKLWEVEHEAIKNDSKLKKIKLKMTGILFSSHGEKKVAYYMIQSFVLGIFPPVTEKVWESESTDASEDEQPPPKPKSPPKKVDKDSDDEGDKTSKKGKSKKTSPPSGKSKQASLMSFFKKK